MASDQPQCQALRLSDGEACQDTATNANNLFCKFHAKQAFGLYTGYKRRNGQLDAIDDDAPMYLRNANTPLANDNFDSIKEESVLQEVHSHLFEKYVLLSKVIDARKLHHKHFYPLQVDYGHQAYLDKLSSQRHTLLRALGMLEKRTAQVLYEKEKWFAWVRKVQETEEASREKEQKKVKQEAALFKRHMKTLQTRLDRMRQKEEKKRQDAYLEDAYKERISMSTDESDDDGAWDPIEDMEDDKRYRYIDLIKHFLWINVLDPAETTAHPAENTTHPAGSTVDTKEPADSCESQVPVTKHMKKAKGKSAATSKLTPSGHGPHGSSATTDMADRGQKRLLAMQQSGQSTTGADLQEPDKINIETEAEMRKRLVEGVEKNYDGVWGIQVVGTMDNPHETAERTAPMTEDEIESVVSDIREIKRLLLSRLILAQSSLLPAAIRANSVEEFLNDTDVAESDLRDLCLKVADPSLQVIRDACADFARGNGVNDDVQEPSEDETDDDDDDVDESLPDLITENQRYAHLHTEQWPLEKYLANTAVVSRRDKKSASRKMKVRICGKSIWNHASEKAMSRDGWLQFSVMAKDCNLENALQLCRNWAEFSDLNLLNVWQFFPASSWASWGGNRLVQQLQELAFFPYFVDFDAQQHSRHEKVGGRSQGRRRHDIIETRNIVVGHMKRNDPVTRRFLQYLVMRAGEVLVLVRDGKTGRVITAPPKEHLWTYRRKQGIGRASKNEYVNVLEVGPEYFDMLDTLRKWRFRFDDYYDVFLWDFVPCQSPMDMYNVIIHELHNAWRITSPRSIYAHMEPLLRTLTREEGSMRTRQIKTGENITSLWEQLMDERNEYVLFGTDGKQITSSDASDQNISPYIFYNDANAVEDRVLFPDELFSQKKSVPFREINNGVNRIESGLLPSTARHVLKGLKDMAMSDLEDEPHAKSPDSEFDEKRRHLWDLPQVWESAIAQVRREMPRGERGNLLKRTGLDKMHQNLSYDERLDESDALEMMERDRSVEFKESLHEGDLEPGSIKNYYDVQDKIDKMLQLAHFGSTEWAWFVIEVMDWLQLRANAGEYSHDPASPWPHSFILHDLVRAFATVAMFFPGLAVTETITKFIESDQCEELRKSGLFDPKQRAGKLPDRRSRTSYRYRKPEFWAKWKEVLESPDYYTDAYPFDWSLAIRPIIAKLYRAGVIAPAYYQNDQQVVPGVATANTEPHRPDALDLFINYEDPHGNCPVTWAPSYLHPYQWPVLLPIAQRFAKGRESVRFALLRLWSAPHFYPLMVGLQSRHGTSFLDSVGRSWEWKFVPKDMPGSEFSAHFTTEKRLSLLRRQFGDCVVSRGDLILVMAEDVEELLKTCVAVTFAMQTKPWLREVDLWKSFIDVDLEFLEELDDFWLD